MKFGFLDLELPISVLGPPIYTVFTNRFPKVPFSEPPCTLFPIPPVLETPTEKIVTKFQGGSRGVNREFKFVFIV